jgi:cation:H+ antiporter
MLDFLLLAVSLAILLGAANYFVEGLAGIAERLRVPKLVIGLTLVAFGTSTPELVVNSISAWRGVTSLAFGNLIGACLLNVGVVLAFSAIIHPLGFQRSLVTRELPLLALTAGAVLLMSLDGELARNDGGVLLIFFLLYLTYSLRQARRGLRGSEPTSPPRPWYKLAGFTAGGFVAISYSARWTVDHAVAFARDLGVSEAIIGLTIISLGTTLPELATSLVAARRGHADLALGNIIGSNLFNLLCILGVVSVLAPVPIPRGGLVDVGTMALLSAILLPLAIRTGNVVSRQEGYLLLGIYLTYLLWRLITI